MGRIVSLVTVSNAVDPSKTIRCEALVDTGASFLVLPLAWKNRLGDFSVTRKVFLETADKRIVPGEVCGPVTLQIEGFPAISSETVFLEMPVQNGVPEVLLGYIPLEQSQAAVDMVGHRLVPVQTLDLK